MRLESTRRFRQDMRRILARNYDPEELDAVVRALMDGEILGPEYRDHALQGKYSGLRECHIGFNWILLYRIRGATLRLVRTGTHADIF